MAGNSDNDGNVVNDDNEENDDNGEIFGDSLSFSPFLVTFLVSNFANHYFFHFFW